MPLFSFIIFAISYWYSIIFIAFFFTPPLRRYCSLTLSHSPAFAFAIIFFDYATEYFTPLLFSPGFVCHADFISPLLPPLITPCHFAFIFDYYAITPLFRFSLLPPFSFFDIFSWYCHYFRFSLHIDFHWCFSFADFRRCWRALLRQPDALIISPFSSRRRCQRQRYAASAAACMPLADFQLSTLLTLSSLSPAYLLRHDILHFHWCHWYFHWFHTPLISYFHYYAITPLLLSFSLR